MPGGLSALDTVLACAKIYHDATQILDLGKDILYMDPVERTQVSDQCYHALRKSIYQGSLAPGARLDLNELEAEFGVSRTPLTQAIRRLEWDGLVRVEPYSGTFVADPSVEELLEAADVKLALGLFAARLVFPRFNEEQIQRILGYLNTMESSTDWADPEQRLQAMRNIENIFVALIKNRYLLDIWNRTNAFLRLGALKGMKRHPADLDVLVIVGKAVQNQDPEPIVALMEMQRRRYEEWIRNNHG